MDGKGTIFQQCGGPTKSWELGRNRIPAALQFVSTQMSNNWKSVETLEWLKRNRDPIKRLHQDDAHSNLLSNQVGSIQPKHSVVTLELIPVAAKRKVRVFSTISRVKPFIPVVGFEVFGFKF